MKMVGIPPAMDTDVEDVAWALQTASSLWKRNERVDAIVWLRRAAQAAGEAEHDDRALELARDAAELSDWIAKNPVSVSQMEAVSSIPPHETGGVDDLLRASIPDIPIEVNPQVSMSAMTEPTAFMPMKIPVAGVAAVAPPPPLPQSPPPPPMQEPPLAATPVPAPSDAAPVVFQSVSERSSAHVQSAEEVHAGMLDPWAQQPEEEAPRPQVISVSPDSSVVSSEDYDDEVVTSARLVLPPAEPAVVMTAPAPAAAPPPVPPPLPPIVKPVALQEQEDDEAVTSSMLVAAQVPAVPAPRSPSEPPAPPSPPVQRFPPERTLVSAGVAPAAAEKKAPAVQLVKRVDLSAVEALSDLPDDARSELESIAEVHDLSRDEEVMGFAFAFVVSGAVDVAAQIVDAAAERLVEGAVLKAKGSVAESVPLRLICASEKAVIATWTAEQIEPAFKTCPWVEDDLRASANRMQALVGVTLGPLADRLDAALRAQVTSRLELRELAEGDVLVEAGQPVRELCLVGQGSIEVVKDGAVVSEVAVGDFLFPAEIMGGGKAAATARAGKGGALVLAGARSVAQELMMTCPPLLEIFAGM